MNKTLSLLTLGEFFERLNFYGTETILVLYLVHLFRVSDQVDYSIFGIYVSLSYALSVIGAIIADKWLGQYKAIMFGCVLLILGNFILTLHTPSLLYYGLSCALLGTGFFKPNCTSLVGNLFDNDSERKERGYTFFYVGLNTGAILGPIFYGLLVEYLGWNDIFLFSACTMLITFCMLLSRKDKLKQFSIPSTVQNLGSNLIYIATIAMSFIVLLLFLHPLQYNYVMIMALIFICLYVIILLTKQAPHQRKQLSGVILLCILSILFFATSFQIGSTLMMFIQRDVNHTIFNWQIPTNMFSSLNPLFVVLAAPIVALIWKRLTKANIHPALTVKLAIGLFLGMIGFICFKYATVDSVQYSTYSPLVWIIMGNLFLGAGEICISPAILTAINDYSTDNMKSTMVSIWFLCVAVAGYISSFLAKLSDQNPAVHNNHLTQLTLYNHTFSTIALIMLISGLFVLALTPVFRRLLH